MNNLNFFFDYLIATLRLTATEALQLQIQALRANIPHQILVMLPYAIALLALVGLMGKSTPPKALGTPYFGENRHSDSTASKINT